MTKKRKRRPRKSEMSYVGLTRKVDYSPWMRLVHGKTYTVEKIKMPSGRVRANVTDDFDRVRLFYDSEKDFEMEWS